MCGRRFCSREGFMAFTIDIRRHLAVALAVLLLAAAAAPLCLMLASPAMAMAMDAPLPLQSSSECDSSGAGSMSACPYAQDEAPATASAVDLGSLLVTPISPQDASLSTVGSPVGLEPFAAASSPPAHLTPLRI